MSLEWFQAGTVSHLAVGPHAGVAWPIHHGYQTIPPELGNEVVPDVEMDGAPMGKATIYVCLFSAVWTWVDPV